MCMNLLKGREPVHGNLVHHCSVLGLGMVPRPGDGPYRPGDGSCVLGLGMGAMKVHEQRSCFVSQQN